jgi:hypothetical protein
MLIDIFHDTVSDALANQHSDEIVIMHSGLQKLGAASEHSWAILACNGRGRPRMICDASAVTQARRFTAQADIIGPCHFVALKVDPLWCPKQIHQHF